MLLKLLDVHVLPSFSRRAPPKPPTQTELETELKSASSSALKIIHAGGIVECYYMAVPAKRIIAKYPSFMLAKPDVFRRPWESVVRPNQTLKPGEKFYLITRRTLEKLLQKTKKPNKDVPRTSFVSQASNDPSCISEASGSFSSVLKKKSSTRKHGNGRKTKKPNKDVPRTSFVAQASNDPSCVSEASGSFSSVLKKKSSTRKHGNGDASIVSGSFSSSSKKKSSNRKHGNEASSVSEVSGSFTGAFKKKSSSNRKHVGFVGIDRKPSSKVADKSTQRVDKAQAQVRKRRPRHGMIWQPTLDTITEKNND